MAYLRIISDVHQHYELYGNIANGAEHSIQIGDMGFDYLSLDKYVDSDCHVFFGGNHDNYDIYNQSPHALGDYGTLDIDAEWLQDAVLSVKVGYIRGAFSVDWSYRNNRMVHGHPKCLWEEEQLTHDDMEAALEWYTKEKPDIMLSHTVPHSVGEIVPGKERLVDWGYNPDTFTTNTQQLLEACLQVHQPRLWICGHLHRYYQFTHMGTEFICLDHIHNEYGKPCYVDINAEGKVERVV